MSETCRFIYDNKSQLLHQFGTSRHFHKGKVRRRTNHEGPEGEQLYCSTLFSTSALDGGGWLTPRPGRFILRKDPLHIYRRLGGPQGRSGRVRKISPPPGFDPRTVQPVASRYTDCVIPGPTGYIWTRANCQYRDSTTGSIFTFQKVQRNRIFRELELSVHMVT